MQHFGLFWNYFFGYYFFRTMSQALHTVDQFSSCVALAVRWVPLLWVCLPHTDSYAWLHVAHIFLLITNYFIWLSFVQLRLSGISGLHHLLCHSPLSMQVRWSKIALGHHHCIVSSNLPQRLAAPETSTPAQLGFRNPGQYYIIFFRQFNKVCIPGKMLSTALQITPKRTDQCNALLTRAEL